jgi:hypothetical protein
LLLAVSGLGSGLFAAPNVAAIMNAVPAEQRGAANGMRSTFQNSGMVLSIGLFFSLMVVGLASSLPSTMYAGLTQQGVPAGAAHQVASLPPVGVLFAAFLGYNPIKSLLEPSGALTHVGHQHAATLTGKQFFPQLISAPFHHGLVIVFLLAIGMSVVGAFASLSRGSRYVHDEHGRRDEMAGSAEPAGVSS